jgi:hypothetical protein
MQQKVGPSHGTTLGTPSMSKKDELSFCGKESTVIDKSALLPNASLPSCGFEEASSATMAASTACCSARDRPATCMVRPPPLSSETIPGVRETREQSSKEMHGK